VSIFCIADDGIHPTTSGDTRWRESWEFDWADVDRRLGGGCRVVLHRGTSTCEVRWWLVVDGAVVEDSHEIVELPAPAVGRPLDLHLGSVALRAVHPLRSTRITSAGGSSLIFTAFGEPFTFSFSGQRVTAGDRHYEWPGSVRGTLRLAGGRTVEVDARAFHRHAWGVPSPTAPVVDAVRAVADDDVFVAVSWHRTPEGRRLPLGYIHVGEEFHGVEKARLHVDRDDSGRPRGCDLLVATADRRDFRLIGSVIAAADGESPALTEFRFGGVRAGGILIAAPGR